MVIGPLQLLGWVFSRMDESPRVQKCSELGQVGVFVLIMVMFILLFPVWMAVCALKAFVLFFLRFRRYKAFKRRALLYYRNFLEAK